MKHYETPMALMIAVTNEDVLTLSGRGVEAEGRNVPNAKYSSFFPTISNT